MRRLNNVEGIGSCNGAFSPLHKSESSLVNTLKQAAMTCMLELDFSALNITAAVETSERLGLSPHTTREKGEKLRCTSTYL